MHALRTNIRELVSRHVEQADDRELLGIVTALYGKPEQEVPAPAPASARAGAPRMLDEPRFELAVLGVVRDRTTGLEWTRSNVTEKSVPWADAEKACAAHQFAGGGWRLPTIKELLTLVDYERHNPSIDSTFFECEAGWYWTSTPYAPSPGVYAWFVGFGYGLASCGARDYRGFVRAVRASQ